MNKRIVVCLAALCIILLMVPKAKAAEVAAGSYGENLHWSLSDAGVLTVSGTGLMTSKSGYEYPWYPYLDEIRSVVIENGVTTIGTYAFSGCQNLTQVEIPESVISIREGAFEYCTGMVAFSVDPENAYFSNDGAGVLFDKDQMILIQAPGAFRGDYTVPDSVITIYPRAFSKCDQLSSVTIGKGVQVIGEYAFESCDYLETVYIASGVDEIAQLAFSDCDNLRAITVDDLNSRYSSDGFGVLFDKTQEELIQAPGAISGIYAIPNTVTDIGDYAFYNCNELTGIVGGENVESIGLRAFEYCDNLTRVTLSDSVTYLDYYVFAWCNNLTSVQLGSGLTEISAYTFYDCKNLKEVNVPESVSAIGYAAFSGCRWLEKIEIPSGVTSVGEWAFAHCDRLKVVYFYGDAPTIYSTSFWDAVTTVFYQADNATWTAGKRQNYGGYITWVPYCEIASGWSGNTHWTLTSDGTLTVFGTGNMRNYDYDEARPWEEYADRIFSVVVESGVAVIGECAFKGLTKLSSVTLPSSGLSGIREAAFYGCAALKEIYIPDGVYTIWAYTFKGCSSLESVRLPKTLVKIDQGAFENCTALPDIFIPTDVEFIGSWSFKGCTALEEVDMQWADATEIREGAFKNCSSLTKIILPANIQVLGDSCFYGIGATSFVVPKTVTRIEGWCFARAYFLTEIIFEGDAPVIGEGAFNKITVTAYYSGGNAGWTGSVMQNYGGTVSWKAE